MFKLLRSIFSLAVLSATFLSAQVAPRAWQEHISINSSNSVTKSGTYVYGSNRAEIIYFDEKELAPQSHSKINGLSDVGIRLLRNNPYNNKVIVAYDNCNIDVITNKNVVQNYPDFKLKALNGKKLINEITFAKQLAYLACGFGIVVFDTEKMEIKDTYIIGPNASELEVFQVALNDSLIFAATTDGIYYANYKTKILNNFQSWIKQTDLPIGPYKGIVSVNNVLLTAYCPSSLADSLKGRDTIYELDRTNKWIKYPPTASSGGSILKLGPTYQNSFSYVDQSSIVVLNQPDGSIVNHLSSFNGITDYGQIRDVYFDKNYTGNVSYWIADNRFGLFQTLGYYPYEKQNKLARNGTNSTQIAMLDISQGTVALAPSLIGNAGVPNYSREGLNVLSEGEWTYLPVTDANGQAFQDVTSVLIDRKDPSQLWATSWGTGVLLYKDKQLKTVFTPNNTTMPVYADGLPRCGGLSMDKDGNVFFAHSDQKGLLGIINTEGKYQNLYFETGGFTRKTFIDHNGLIWLLHERDGGITVYKPEIKNNLFASPVKNVNYRSIDNNPGTGNLESLGVFSIAEDHDGRIWIGTTAGVQVIYNSSALFKGGDYDAQPIKIVQDGNVELLLGKETVTSIIVDGANNKWCGTQLGGLYCFSPDGQTQLYHFTIDNSPLFSNSIIDINYDATSGDIYIGTDIGLQSFRSTSIEGGEQYSNVHAFPNPVKPNYTGHVFVRGLMDNSIVKIADESGNLVWETKSSGGQIEWPVSTLNGSRVSSGVYLVYASTTTGDYKAVAKILVVN